MTDYLLIQKKRGDEGCDGFKIVFNLYTQENVNVPHKFEMSSEMEKMISQTSFKPGKHNKILIHGFQDSALDAGFQLIKNNYLEHNDYNVWIFDWSVVAAGPPMNYESVVKRMEATGACMAKFVKEIIKAGTKDIHLIGHSLGAHMTGYIAENLNLIIRKDYKVARITGLDPAFPLFRVGQKQSRVLSKDDADFVDILHTNGQFFGQTEAIGHVDFYLNGGFNQPLCNQFGNVCNHMSAMTYFAESIKTKASAKFEYKGFYGYPCPNIDEYIAGNWPFKKPDTLMGEYVDKDTRGTYIVMTNAKEPYGRGKELYE